MRGFRTPSNDSSSLLVTIDTNHCAVRKPGGSFELSAIKGSPINESAYQTERASRNANEHRTDPDHPGLKNGKKIIELNGMAMIRTFIRLSNQELSGGGRGTLPGVPQMMKPLKKNRSVSEGEDTPPS